MDEDVEGSTPSRHPPRTLMGSFFICGTTRSIMLISMILHIVQTARHTSFIRTTWLSSCTSVAKHLGGRDETIVIKHR